MLVGSSVTDLAWLDGIPTDRPVLVVAEGLVHYLAKEEGTRLFRGVTKTFPSGELIFDIYSHTMVWLISKLTAFRKTGTVLRSDGG
jgi:O-methyltransferase involved in polyketide biosynthesis